MRKIVFSLAAVLILSFSCQYIEWPDAKRLEITHPDNYLTFTTDGSASLSLYNWGNNSPVLFYSKDGKTWRRWDYSPISFNRKHPLYLCGENPDGFSRSITFFSRFVSEGDPISVSGDVMALISYEDKVTTIPCENCFYQLFQNCTNITRAPSISATTLKKFCCMGMFDGCTGLTEVPDLPAANLADYCYGEMFQGCSSMTIAPQLPATTLAEKCYFCMFLGCSGLIEAPQLPAIDLADYCYDCMFMGCSSLDKAPDLPATALAYACYKDMFCGCGKLTSAPILPSTTLAARCYEGMFLGCSNLTYVKCLATDINNYDSLYCWLEGVAPSGVFVKASEMNDWPRGDSGIPQGWTISE